ncbi:MAG: hypothetical protein Kow0089_06390 [Desulfobulbaceae bacterium]
MRTFFLSLLLIAICVPTVAPAQPPPPARVVLGEVAREMVAENGVYVGQVVYDRVSNVSAEVPGLADRVLVEAGDLVRKGDPLVELDTELLDQDIALRKTATWRAGLRIELANRNLERTRTLLSRKGASEKDLDEALFARDDALAEKKSLEQELEKLTIRKRKSRITAPFDGIVLERHVEVGNWVQQTTSLFSLGSTSDLVVRVPVEEGILPFITRGDEVTVRISSLDREIRGTVKRIEPVADARTRNIFLVVAIPPQETVVANLSATVFVPTSPRHELAVFPRDALVHFQGKDFIYTVKEGKAALLPVHVVAYLGDRVAADDSHLTAALPVVIEGNERLRPDQAVLVTGEK